MYFDLASLVDRKKWRGIIRSIYFIIININAMENYLDIPDESAENGWENACLEIENLDEYNTNKNIKRLIDEHCKKCRRCMEIRHTFLVLQEGLPSVDTSTLEEQKSFSRVMKRIHQGLDEEFFDE